MVQLLRKVLASVTPGLLGIFILSLSSSDPGSSSDSPPPPDDPSVSPPDIDDNNAPDPTGDSVSFVGASGITPQVVQDCGTWTCSLYFSRSETRWIADNGTPAAI